MDPQSPAPPGRRSFLQYVTFGLGAVASVAAAVPIVGYLLGLRKRPIDWVPLARRPTSSQAKRAWSRSSTSR